MYTNIMSPNGDDYLELVSGINLFSNTATSRTGDLPSVKSGGGPAISQGPEKVEMLFAHLKHTLKLDRLRLCGMSDARDELLLAATTQNLRRMAKLLGRPPQTPEVTAPA
jgi:hypothetical protein